MSKKLTGGDIFRFGLLLVALIIVPLISRRAVVDVSKYEYGIIRSSQQIADIFSYNKSVTICVLGAIMLITILMDIFVDNKRIDFKKASLVLLAGFLLLNFLSAVFSPYKYVAFNGISERYEGFFVILGYITLCFAAIIYTDNPVKAKLMLLGVALSGLFVGAIGTFQYFGLDIFKTDLGNRLVLGDMYKEGGTNLAIKLDSVYSTLYNPNCVGLFMGMLVPVTLIMTLVLPVKSKLKYIFGLSFITCVIALVGSNSLGGFLGAGMGIVFFVVISLVYFICKRNKKGIALITVLIIVMGAGATGFAASDARVIEKLNIIVSALKNPDEIKGNSFYEGVSVKEMSADINTKGGVITIDFTVQPPSFLQNGNMLDVTKQEEAYIYNVQGVAQTKLEIINDIYSVSMTDDNNTTTSFLFGIFDNSVSVLDKFGNPVDASQPVKTIGFKGMERLGSNRGYIWSRSIPLLFENIFVGKGPDTFSLEFPQDDVYGKLEFLGNPYVIVDKPHNMYLQIGINTGLLSLVLFLLLMAVYFFNTVKSVFKTDNISLAGVKLAFLTGVIGYLTAGITTDSVVSVGPVFWILLGIGFALNSMDINSLEE